MGKMHIATAERFGLSVLMILLLQLLLE